jgi:hypothetical protein
MRQASTASAPTIAAAIDPIGKSMCVSALLAFGSGFSALVRGFCFWFSVAARL